MNVQFSSTVVLICLLYMADGMTNQHSKHLAVCLYFWFKKIHFLTLTTKLAYLSGRRLASVDIITR